MTDVSTHIAINSPPSRVWGVLMDFAQYKKWNPFIIHISGDTRPGSSLRVALRFSASKPTEFSPIVRISGEYDFCWKGKVLIPGLFDGEHHFRVEKSETGSVFHHYEHFSGLLAPFMGAKFYATAKERFGAMNQALKSRVEMLNAAAEVASGLTLRTEEAARDAVPV